METTTTNPEAEYERIGSARRNLQTGDVEKMTAGQWYPWPAGTQSVNWKKPLTPKATLRGERVDYATTRIGDRLILDGTTPVIVTNLAVYINSSHDRRETGVSVRPIAGGRARPVAMHRLTGCPYCAPDELCAIHV